MRPLTVRFEDGYCSITVVNHRLITIIRFIVKNYTHPWKDFANKFRLVLHAYEIFFSEIVCDSHDRKTKQGPYTVCMPCPPCLHLPGQIRLKPYGAARPFIYFLLLCLSIRGTTLQALYSLVVVVMCSSDQWNRYSGHCRSVSGLLVMWMTRMEMLGPRHNCVWGRAFIQIREQCIISAPTVRHWQLCLRYIVQA